MMPDRSPPTDLPQLSASALPVSDSADPRVRGRWLREARAAWVVAAIVVISIFLAGAWTELTARQVVCAGTACFDWQLTEEEAQALAAQSVSPSFYAAYTVALEAVLAAVCTALGVVIFWRRSDHRMALVASLILVTFGLTFSDAADALTLDHPAWRVPVQAVAALGVPAFFLLFYIFPDGRFVPRWTRWWLVVGLTASLVNRLFPGSPFDLLHLPLVNLLLWSGTLITAFYAQFHRYRRVSTPTQRQQTKWVVFGMAVTLAGVLGLSLLLIPFPHLNKPGSPENLVLNTAFTLFLLCLPLSIGTAVLRHQLWNIDLVINRTLVYGALTASVVGIYVLVVGGLGMLLQVQGNLIVSIIAAGLIAVLFAPLRDRLQRSVNRLMYGERDDPYAVLARLGQRLEATLAPAAVLPTAARTVAESLKLPYTAIEIEREGAFRTAAATGEPVKDTLRLPLHYGGETVGRLVLGTRAGEGAFASADRRLLDDLTRQIGVAVHAVRLTEEALRLSADLQRSRERLVTAREAERRRLRRDLHDGLGPQLAALTMKAEAARDLLTADPARSDALLAEITGEAQAAVADVRRLVYGLRPPALDELGLLGALRTHAAHGEHDGLRVTVDAPEELPPLSAAVEVAAYRIALEAVNNAARHSGARGCSVRLSTDEPEGLLLEVTDDGVGIPEHRSAGIGLHSMRERAEELGGSCAVEALPAGGTRVRAVLPLARGVGEGEAVEPGIRGA